MDKPKRNSMEFKNYKEIIKGKNVLDYRTLSLTIEELEKIRKERLLSEMKRIIQNNRINKPTNHNRINDQETDYYKIDLSVDDIHEIVSTLVDIEASSLGPDYETTRAASFYGAILDKWNSLLILDQTE